jgi:hypothetical protein
LGSRKVWQSLPVEVGKSKTVGLKKWKEPDLSLLLWKMLACVDEF